MSAQMNTMSLKDAMSAVNHRLDVTCKAKSLKPHRKSHSHKIDELEAFCRIDPLLAALHKDFMGLKADNERSMREFGADSPMVEIAAEAEDSAWCAMQTRLLEVRGDRDLMRSAQGMILDSEREEEREAQQREIEKVQKFADHMRVLHTINAKTDARKTKDRNWLDLLMIYAFFFHKQFMQDITKGPRQHLGMAAA